MELNKDQIEIICFRVEEEFKVISKVLKSYGEEIENITNRVDLLENKLSDLSIFFNEEVASLNRRIDKI